MSSKRLFFVGGNWKCNLNRETITNLVRELNNAKIPNEKVVEVVVAPPYVYLDCVINIISSEIHVAAQNCWGEAKGAFTGEISPSMLTDLGVEWVILGHSERRNVIKESAEMVGKKTGLALDTGLKVILCVGELLAEREANQTQEVIASQLKPCLEHIKDWSKVVIAYEPVWAIGTGKTASPDQAQEVHLFIREWLGKNVSADVAKSTRIIYGGSVNKGNSDELAKKKDVDGFLVGGASLIAADFIPIIQSSKHKY
jgi:triosephosphate isomerase